NRAIVEFGFLNLAFFPAADVREEKTVRPFCLRVLEQWDQTAAIKFYLLRDFGAGNFSQCRENINMRGERVAILCVIESRGPAPESRHSRATFVGGGFLAMHSGIEE